MAYIDRITRGKTKNLTPVPDAVNNAVCAVAEVIYASETMKITSESVGNHSRSYATKNDTAYEIDKLKKATVYLARTGLLYGGMS